MLLRGMLSSRTYFCDACARWRKGGVENANRRIRRSLPRGADLNAICEHDIQEIAMTMVVPRLVVNGHAARGLAAGLRIGRGAAPRPRRVAGRNAAKCRHSCSACSRS